MQEIRAARQFEICSLHFAIVNALQSANRKVKIAN
jgi:hypothetical protein